MKILVCEDDKIVLKVIEVALEGEQAEITYAKDGHKAMQLLKDGQAYDLIVTDIHMPYHNGDEIINLVRLEQKRNTPIILISSDNDEEIISLSKKMGVNEFMEKPLDPAKFKKTVKRLLQ